MRARAIASQRGHPKRGRPPRQAPLRCITCRPGHEAPAPRKSCPADDHCTTIGADTATLLAEAVYSHTDLPSLADVRYGRGIHWGFSTELNGGGCPAIQNPAGCRNGGYYTRDAWGWRAKGALNYTVGRWALSPSLGLGQDVHGYSVDSQLVGGRKQATAGFSATLDKTWFANLTYTNYLGHPTYDTLADHDFATLSFGANF